MLKGFICPDKKKVTTIDCISGCRMKERCMPLPNLMFIVTSERKWEGIPSCTQLINGTRQEYLKITNDYYIKPNSMAFAMLGTMSHAGIEPGKGIKVTKINDTEIECEKKMNLWNITGTADYVIKENSIRELVDYKTWGTFKVTKLYKNDVKDLIRQISFYKHAYEEVAKNKIDKCKVYVVLRDGGTWSSKGMLKKAGVPEDKLDMTTEYKEVIPDDYNKTKSYFEYKRDALLNCFRTNTIPMKCNDEETWNGKRCEFYCPVSDICKGV